jgi:hypothetical protein
LSVFLEGFLSNTARMFQYSYSFSSVFETPGHPVGLHSYFKCTLTFSFPPTLPPSSLYYIRAFSSLLSFRKHPPDCSLGLISGPFQSHPMWLCLCFRSRTVIILRLGLH